MIASRTSQTSVVTVHHARHGVKRPSPPLNHPVTRPASPTSERFWINLQARYDLEVEKDRLGAALDDIQPLSATG